MNEYERLHMPVLPRATLEALSPRPGGRYLDGTLGLGGHTERILRLAPGSNVCGLDWDVQSLELAEKRLEPFGDRIKYFHLPFGEFPSALAGVGWDSLDGALLDLGVSSPQLDNPERGFSFYGDGPLDMRMDGTSGKRTAWHLVNRGSFEELKNCIALYGEEPQAGRIARHIVDARNQGSIDGTERLAEIISSAYPAAWRKKARKHPATRTFQALRMAVNDELGQLRLFIDKILPFLSPGGRLAVISFHSLEDRIVKHAMRGWAAGCICPPHVPICVCGHKPQVRILFKKPVVADEEEIASNPRSRSAKLRAIEKLDAS